MVDRIAVIEPEGAVDTRSAQDFEKAILARLAEEVARFIVGFEKVELISSAGLRVLVMLAKRVDQASGGLVLYGLSDHVRTVFDVTGLTDHFVIAATEGDALARLQSPRDEGSEGARGKLSDLVARLLAVGHPPVSRATAANRTSTHPPARALADHIVELLAARGQSSPHKTRR